MKRWCRDEMELVPGLFGVDCVLGKGRGRRNGIGVGNRVSGRKGTTLAVGFNPAYGLNERTERPVPVSPRTGLGSEKAK